jgi:hypothetical protein
VWFPSSIYLEEYGEIDKEIGKKNIKTIPCLETT